MSDLATWLRAQLDYQRLLGETLQALGGPRSPLSDESGSMLQKAGDLLVADAAAGRQLLTVHHQDGGDCSTCVQWRDDEDPDGGRTAYPGSMRWPCSTVRLLALPHADRPGYDEAWRP